MGPIKIGRILFLALVCELFMAISAQAAPSITSISGTANHGQTITISGLGFGTKSQVVPVVYDDMETGSFTNGWSGTNQLSISTSQRRHGNSTYAGYCNMNAEKWCNFEGGSNGNVWFVQYWFYLGSNFVWNRDINLSLGNVKIFRMWNTGTSAENFVIAWNAYDVVAINETLSFPNWNPVVPGTNYVDTVLGHGDPGNIDPGHIGWKKFAGDVSTNKWHLFQFEYSEGKGTGHLKMWWNGRKIIDRSNLDFGSTTKRPKVVGFYNSHSTNGSNADFFIDDAYIDSSWARVEVGNASTYEACTHREIQIPSGWAATSVSVKFNKGSFNTSDPVYFFVVDSQGNVSNGYGPISIGSTGGIPTRTPVFPLINPIL